jgi:hypothetical protein
MKKMPASFRRRDAMENFNEAPLATLGNNEEETK